MLRATIEVLWRCEKTNKILFLSLKNKRFIVCIIQINVIFLFYSESYMCDLRNFFTLFSGTSLKKYFYKILLHPHLSTSPTPPSPPSNAVGWGEGGARDLLRMREAQYTSRANTNHKLPPFPSPCSKNRLSSPLRPPKRGHSFLRNSLTVAVYHLFLAEFYLAAPGSFELRVFECGRSHICVSIF